MFFTASKIFWLLAEPLTVVFLLVLIALVFGLLGWRRRGLAALGIGVAAMAAICFTSLGFVLLEPLETRFARANPNGPVEGIIVLGGGLDPGVGAAREAWELAEGGDRFVEALRLARLYPEARLVLSGGSGGLGGDGEGDAVAGARFLADFGVDPARLTLDARSRNTAENAAFTRELIAPSSGERWLLVTSAFHMPRAMGAFRKAGLEPLPWPTDFRAPGREGLRVAIGDPLRNAGALSTALKEWIGLVAYSFAGLTGELFPEP